MSAKGAYLTDLDPAYLRRCRHAERMRRCAGCTVPEIARALGVSEAEVKRMLKAARGGGARCS